MYKSWIKERKKLFIFIASVFVIFISVAYAFLNQTVAGTKNQVLNSGNLKLTLNEGNELTLNNALPIYDEVGMIQEPFTFKVVNDGKIPINYAVKLVDVTLENTEKLDTNIVKYGLTKDGVDTIDLLSNLKSNQIDSGMILSNQTIEYSLRLWIDFHVEDEDLINGKSLSYRIDVEAGQVDGTERKVVLNSNGGTLNETAKTVVVGEKYGELPIPTKAGYNFLGWFNEKDEYVDGNSILDSFTEKLVAKWGVNQYTVVFNPNGGSVSPNNKQVNFHEVYGELPIPTKAGSIFLGWFTEELDGEQIESTSIMNISDNHTLYAHWKNPYQDKSGASRPVLSKELIPVKIANNGEVQKADIYEEWYDYDKKVWANAVVLEDGVKTYQDGEVISDSDIESYFVWIPRYKYKIFNDGTEDTLNSTGPKTIEIEFESKEVVPSNGTTVNTWLTHPAFPAFDTNGFWVGKFESGYRDAASTTAAQVNVADATKLIIKPNTYSWRSITLGNMFKTSYDYIRSNESHMMKNTEWGAVAYLSHSKYGVNTEIYINNNSAYLTSCGGNSADASESSTCLNIYGSKNDGIYNQTTTGNISGVFDMNGGAWESVMGNNNKILGNSGIKGLYSDFFTNGEWDKYYDKYVNNSTSTTTYNCRILGDATGEMGPFQNYSSSWYGDYVYFVNSSGPWFDRGGNYGGTSAAGIFRTSNTTGGSYNYLSFRVVIALN